MHKLTIITGKKHSGKTTKLLEIISELKLEGRICAGLIAKGTFVENKRNSFTLLDIESNKTCEFMSTVKNDEFQKIGKFYINPKGISFGNMVLNSSINSFAEYIVIDEIGPLELEGNGWSENLERLLKTNKKLIIVVRQGFVETICKKFEIKEYNLINI
jgi:nucleoside-triphosphatase THEP1